MKTEHICPGCKIEGKINYLIFKSKKLFCKVCNWIYEPE